jgi:hypothetical protein
MYRMQDMRVVSLFLKGWRFGVGVWGMGNGGVSMGRGFLDV